MERKKIGIGYEDYKRMIDDGCYYVDKTLLVRDILKQGGMVTLFTRPRRFGKTLALSMLRTFFEAEVGPDGNAVDNSRYFAGMRVMGCGEEVLSKMGRHPVIKLSLKSARQPDFRTAMLRLRDQIVSEFLRHEYLCGSKRLSATEIQTLKDLMLPEREVKVRSEEDLMREMGRYATSLQILSSALAKHHGQMHQHLRRRRVVLPRLPPLAPLRRAGLRAALEPRGGGRSARHRTGTPSPP